MTETKNRGFYYECLISSLTEYALIDGSGDIRGTAPNLTGIINLKNKYGWGYIHKAKYENNILTIGEQLE